MVTLLLEFRADSWAGQGQTGVFDDPGTGTEARVHQSVLKTDQAKYKRNLLRQSFPKRFSGEIDFAANFFY